MKNEEAEHGRFYIGSPLSARIKETKLATRTEVIPETAEKNVCTMSNRWTQMFFSVVSVPSVHYYFYKGWFAQSTIRNDRRIAIVRRNYVPEF